MARYLDGHKKTSEHLPRLTRTTGGQIYLKKPEKHTAKRIS